MKYFFTCGIILALLVIAHSRCTSSHPIADKGLDIDSSFLGNFTDDYNIRYSINNNSFIQHPGVRYHLLLYNKEEQYFIARNDSANVSDGGLYTRIDIMRFSNMEPWRWGFCLTAYRAPDMATAIRTAAADRSNPRKGCGGYPFSRMKRAD
ncbi:MAG: hypothetical protein QM687_07435 [Ferruginibacter sp.]